MRALSLLSLLLLAACASGASPEGASLGSGPQLPPRITGATSTTWDEVYLSPDLVTASLEVAAPPDAAWAALLQVYEELGIPLGEVDPGIRVVSNLRFVVSRRLAGERPSRYLSCGRGPAGDHADSYRLQLSIVSRIRPAGEGGSRVETELLGVGTNMEGTSNTRVACTSTHQLEIRIAGLVRLRVENRDPGGS